MSTPQLSLLVGNVQLLVDPTSKDGSLRFSQDNFEGVELQLDGFTGTLRLRPVDAASHHTVSPTEKRSTPEKRNILLTEEENSTPKRSRREQETVVESEQKKAKADSDDSSSHRDEEGTLLGQPDLSQTQDFSFSMDDTSSVDKNTSQHPASSQTEDERRAAARVSLGPSSPNRQSAPPCARWGHTCTPLSNGNFLIYGGQSLTDDTATSLSDIKLYNGSTWSEPFHCFGENIEWHTCTYIPDRKLVVSIGAAKDNNHQVHVLDTEIWLWYPPTLSGPIPASRTGHTTVLLGTHQLVVFGGASAKSHQFVSSSLKVLDTRLWKWTSQRVTGTAPPPRSYHTANVIQNDVMVVFGGNNSEKCFDSLHVLEKWHWRNVLATGTGPAPRTGHAAVVWDDTKIFVCGGWDPSESESQDHVVFADCFILDTITWTWSKGPSLQTARAGHTAVLVRDNRIMVFGGRTVGDELLQDVEFIDLD